MLIEDEPIGNQQSSAGRHHVGILASLGALCFGKPHPVTQSAPALPRRGRRCHLESLEDRRLMAGDLTPHVLLGSVYFEEATGDDSQPDVIQVSFDGGAAGTTLNRLVIDGDKLGDGLSTGDVFFDTAAGGLGAFGDVGLSVVSHDGFTVTGAFSRRRRHADRLHLQRLRRRRSVQLLAGRRRGPICRRRRRRHQRAGRRRRVPALADHRHLLRAHYVDLTLGGTYWDAFNDNFAAAQTATGLVLDLPNDAYTPTHDYTDRTAGAIVHDAQMPLATIAGWVYHDQDDDGNFDTPAEEGIGGVTLELLKDGVATGITTTTSTEPPRSATTSSSTSTPGTLRRPRSAAGRLARRQRHARQPRRHACTSNDRITGAVLDYGDDGVNYNFGELLPGSIAGRVQSNRSAPTATSTTPQMSARGHPNRPAGHRRQRAGHHADRRPTASTEFTGLAPGEYQVREHQPTDYYDGGERVGSAGGTK